MTFGQIKSIIEQNLLESYKDEKRFKQAIREFKQNILENKTISKIYSLYDDLSSPQGLNENDAKEYLNEGITLIKSLLKESKLPKTTNRNVENKYQQIDDLVYIDPKKINLVERVNTKKQILSILKENKVTYKTEINLPVSAMVSIANKTLKNHIDNLDESAKKDFFEILKEDVSSLEEKYNGMKLQTKEKLTSLMESESDQTLKDVLSETITKIDSENFNQVNYLKLKNLMNSL